MRSLQREAIRKDLKWQNGEYARNNFPSDGMAIARKPGLITYRSAEEWQSCFGRSQMADRVVDRFDQVPFAPEFAVETYLEKNAAGFIHCFDSDACLYLNHSIDRFDIGEGRSAVFL